MYTDLIDRKIAEVKELRDAAVRGVERSYLSGNAELFDRVSKAFDVSSGVVEGLSDLRGKDGFVAQALGDLVADTALARILMEEAAIVGPIVDAATSEPEALD